MRVTLRMKVVTMALGIVVGCTPGVGGDAGVIVDAEDECSVDTADEDCAAGESCVDGECVADGDQTCAVDDDCLGDGGLCAPDDVCHLAEDVTADCSDADDAPAQSGPPHIVIFSVQEGDVTANACGADGDQSLRAFTFSIYSEVSIDEGDVYRSNFTANDDRFIDASVTAATVAPDFYVVRVSVCGDPNEIAAYIDDGTSASNAYCFDATP